MYIHERADWPNFRWDKEKLADLLAGVRHRQGRLIGRLEAVGFRLRQDAVLQALTDDVLKTSEIEGELLDARQVRSSLARRLGIDIGALTPSDRHVDGIVEMMLDATRNYGDFLTSERLFGWHAALFPTGRSGMSRINVAGWRTDAKGPMTVVSGPLGNERIHFEAPAASRLPDEMRAFLDWINSEPDVDLVLRAALAHFWFVTIHPFDDGNGRIARAIADMLLARSEGSAQRFYSLSAQIRAERDDYYDILERTQGGTMDVTPWMEWFVGCLGRAVDAAQATLGSVLVKARFWERHRDVPLNARQRTIVSRMLDGFEGKLTTSKYAKIARCSQDSAGRDIAALVERGMLARSSAGGRSTSYELVIGNDDGE